MRHLMISTAVLSLMVVPAMAQPEPPGSRGKASISRQGAPAPQTAPAPQPAPTPQAAPAPTAQAAPAERSGRGERGGDRGNRGSAPQGAPQPQTAQPPAPPTGQITDRSGNRGPGAQPDNRDNRFGNGRDSNREWRGNDRDHRGEGWRTDSRSNDNRGHGLGNRSGFNGERHDFRGFRDYHRTFRAPQRYRAPSYRRPSGWYPHRWTFGEMLPSLFWGRDYWLYEYEDYGLPTPPYGAVWVRVGNDALMIDQDSGEVITVAYDVFY